MHCLKVLNFNRVCYRLFILITSPQNFSPLPNTNMLTGVACEGDNIIGTVVLTIDNEIDGSLSYWQISQRVGCLPTLCTIAYDSVLEDPLTPHEVLIDFIAVTSEARGKGVGTKLLAWAEETAKQVLIERCPDDVQEHGVLMSLWVRRSRIFLVILRVKLRNHAPPLLKNLTNNTQNMVQQKLQVANSNTNARKLYEKAGYKIVKSTNKQPCHFLSGCILRRFLGDSVWHKMQKPLDAAESIQHKAPSVLVTMTNEATKHEQVHINTLASNNTQQQQLQATPVARKQSFQDALPGAVNITAIAG